MHYNRLQENSVTITGMIYSEVPNKYVCYISTYLV